MAAIVSPGGGESGALDGLIISKSDLAQSFERVLCLTLQEVHLSIISFSFEPPRHKRFGPAIRWSRRVEGVLDPMYPSKLSSLEDLWSPIGKNEVDAMKQKQSSLVRSTHFCLHPLSGFIAPS